MKHSVTNKEMGEKVSAEKRRGSLGKTDKIAPTKDKSRHPSRLSEGKSLQNISLSSSKDSLDRTVFDIELSVSKVKMVQSECKTKSCDVILEDVMKNKKVR